MPGPTLGRNGSTVRKWPEIPVPGELTFESEIQHKYIEYITCHVGLRSTVEKMQSGRRGGNGKVWKWGVAMLNRMVKKGFPKRVTFGQKHKVGDGVK